MIYEGLEGYKLLRRRAIILFQGHLPNKHSILFRLFSWEAFQELIRDFGMLYFPQTSHGTSSFHNLTEIFRRHVGHQYLQLFIQIYC